MSSPIVSIIVPVYNVEAYLSRCLESIVAQTFRDFECILVDDGSTDSSPALCDEWAQRDPRFRVLHQKNGGISAARNSGMDVARGQYLVFSDDDDTLHPQLLSLALAAQAESPPHALVCWKYGPEFPVSLPLQPRPVPQSVDELFLGSDFANVWGKLWSRELVNGFSIRFDESLRWCEDLDFVTRYLLALYQQNGTLSFLLISHVLYRYEEQRPGNVTSQYSRNKLIYEQKTLPEILDLFETQLQSDAGRWAPFCQAQLFALTGRLMDLYRFETDLSPARRRRAIRSCFASPATRRLLALCRQYHVWPAMRFCADHGLVRPAFFLARNCYKPWYIKTIRAWLWIRNKFYWGFRALRRLPPQGKAEP